VEAAGEQPSVVALSPGAAAPALERGPTAAGDRGHDLPIEALDRVWAAVDASTSPATKAAYRSDWGRFQRWAAAGGFGMWPAPAMVVAAYLTAAAQEVKVDGRPAFPSASLSRWASSINQIHTAAGFEAPGRSEVVRRALAGVRRVRKIPPKRRSPLLLADVRLLLEALQPSLGVWPAGVAAHRDAALLLMGFAGAHRRSELTGLRVGDVTVHPVDGLHVQVRSSKTDQEGRGTVRALPYGRDPITCPPCAFLRWRTVLQAYDHGGRTDVIVALRSRGPVGEHCCRSTIQPTPAHPGAASAQPNGSGADDEAVGERWLFPTVHRTGQPSAKAMTGDAVAAMIQRRAAAAGFTPAQVDLLGGHSLRSGFVTEAFRAGADAHSIMRQTGHKDPKMLEVYAREFAPLMGNAVLKINL
jgi:integrase